MADPSNGPPPGPAFFSPSGDEMGVCQAPDETGQNAAGCDSPADHDGHRCSNDAEETVNTNNEAAAAASGSDATHPVTSAGETGGKQGCQKMAAWKKILLWLGGIAILLGIGLGLIGGAAVGGYFLKGCLTPAPLPPPPPPPPPPAPPTVSATLTPDDTNRWAYCGGLPDTAVRFYAYGPSTGDESRQMLVRICNNPFFEGKPERLVLKDGTLMVSEGEGETGAISLDVSKDTRPGGFAADRWQRLSQHFPGRRLLEGSYKGASITLVDPLIVFLPPSSSRGVLAGACEQWRKKPRPEATEKWLLEIWLRCTLGGQRNTATAVSMARQCSVSGCFSRADGAELAARIAAIDTAVKAAGDKPVTPVTVSDDPSAPSR